MSLAEVLPTIEKLTHDDQLELFRILAEKLQPMKQPFPFQPQKIYYIYSPYDAYGAGRMLMEAKKRLQTNRVDPDAI
jgi:hypothetical protein